MAYEKASGTTLSEEQKTAATEELVTTGELADSIGQKDATDLMNEVKQEVIKEGLTDEADIKDAIDDAAKTYNITLTEEQMSKINSLMQNISQYDYDVKSLQKTLENLEGKASESGFFSNLWTSIKNIFTGGGDESDGGIINNTNDDVLGADAVIDSTLEAIENNSKDEGGFWSKVADFFKGLFGGDEDPEEETADEENNDKDPEDSENTDDTTDIDETEDGGSDDTLTDGEADADPIDNNDETVSDGTETDVSGQSDSASNVGETDNSNTSETDSAAVSDTF